MENELQLLKSYRRKPICDAASMPLQCRFDQSAIKRIIPHRDPFLFVHRITGLNLEEKIVAGEYDISPDLPVFKGHFPEYPVFPGSMQLEAVGQLGLSLAHFSAINKAEISESATPPTIRATRIGGAYYRSEVRPGDKMTMLAKAVEWNDYFSTILGQTLTGDDVASVVILEVTFL